MSVFFHGSEGDAGKFERRWGGRILPDGHGLNAKAFGVVSCPTFVVKSSGACQVFGNGQRLSPKDIARLRSIAAMGGE